MERKPLQDSATGDNRSVPSRSYPRYRFLPNVDTAESYYSVYFKVRACRSADNYSAWSSVKKAS